MWFCEVLLVIFNNGVGLVKADGLALFLSEGICSQLPNEIDINYLQRIIRTILGWKFFYSQMLFKIIYNG